MTITVITSSDRAFQGEYQDLSGSAICNILKEAFSNIHLKYELVPDEEVSISTAILKNLDSEWIITTGGTGISPRDIVPDVCRKLCDKEIPGIAEYLRRESLNETPYAVFSRGFAGLKQQTIIVNFPGSEKGAVFCMKLLLPLLKHGSEMTKGKSH
ncbi:MAG: MogA/MoaB family molybdenum cofactor biosynthesis protein [Brevinemataceae bacterium]